MHSQSRRGRPRGADRRQPRAAQSSGALSDDPLHRDLQHHRRHYIDFPELLELARRGVIDTRHVTTRFFPLERVNDAIDYIAKRGDDELLWSMYASDA